MCYTVILHLLYFIQIYNLLYLLFHCLLSQYPSETFGYPYVTEQENTVANHLIILYASTAVDNAITLMNNRPTAGLLPLSVRASKPRELRK